MEERLPDRIKRHFRENKKLYLGILIGVATAGITLAITKTIKSRAVLRGGADCPVKESTGLIGEKAHLMGTPALQSPPNGHSVFFNDNVVGLNQGVVNVLEREGRGHPGYMVKCIENGLTYISQKAAALDLGISPDRLSDHLNGRVAHVHGFTFERINLAA